MPSKTKHLFFLFVIITFSSVTQAFNLKSLLFGETDRDGSSASTPFGTPVTDYAKSRRSDIQCSHYLCEETQDCVQSPINCPCRLPTDIKCEVGDWYTCIRGDKLCEEL